jgi:uncharacterized membrane protein YdjX (TVP38/TMEM64 family)
MQNLFSLRVSKKRWVIRACSFAIIAAAIWAIIYFFDTKAMLRKFLLYLQDVGPWAPVLFILAYIVGCLTFFPGVVLTLGAGVLFGLVKGTLLVATGATLGGSCAFLISRHFARDWVLRKFADNEQFNAIEQATRREGWKIVGLIRLSPVFPFVAMNYIFGLTQVPFWHFAAATFFGLFPLTTLFVYLGVIAGDLARLGSGPVASGTTKWVITILGIISTVIVTYFVTRIARRALSARIPEEGSK